MKNWTLLLAACGWLLASDFAGAQEKFTVKLKELGPGDSSRVELSETQAFKIVTTIAKEKEPKIDQSQRNKQVFYTETVLEQPEGAPRPTRIKRSYEKAIDKMTLGPDKKEVAQAYSGKTVLIEKKGDKYEFRIDGGGPLLQGVADLNNEFNGIDQTNQKKTFIPPGPVALDESWKIDPKGFLGDLTKEGKAEVLKSEGTARLVKVYKKDGRQYGIIESVLDIHIAAAGKGVAGQPDMEMKGTMKITMDACIDGSIAEGRMTGTFQFNSTAAIPTEALGTVNSNSSGTGTIEQTWRELPK
jgi:hypothetical protein